MSRVLQTAFERDRVMQYYWNPKTGRYHNSINNIFVSQKEIMNWLDREESVTRVRLQGLTRRLTNRTLSLSDYQEEFIQVLKRSHLRMGLLGAGGQNHTSSSIYGGIGQRLREEYRYLDGFIDAIASGLLTPKQMMARAGSYANSSASAFYQAQFVSRLENTPIGKILLVRRDLDAQAEHCGDCPRYSTNGQYVYYEMVTIPTRRCKCRSRCRCRLLFRYAKTSNSSSSASA